MEGEGTEVSRATSSHAGRGILSRDLGQPLWVIPKNDPEVKNRIIQEFHFHPVLASILVARASTSSENIHDGLYGKLPDLHNPFLFAEMPQAVKRITQAILSEENILIYGDNDVDGMTGTALLQNF